MGAGPTLVITDLGVLRPDPKTCELTLTELHPGVAEQEVIAATGWKLAVAENLLRTVPPTERELAALRAFRSPGDA
jgi:acyl CoA:acetate/3-ketoacid CoA transferase beta subunit